ncbi:protein O-mannosyl-transferase [Gammaproteobacteria bacterium]
MKQHRLASSSHSKKPWPVAGVSCWGVSQSKFWVGVAFWLLLVATALIYWPGLSGPPLLDDLTNLRPLEQLSNGITTWRDLLWSNESGRLGRPISMLTFVLDYLRSGDATSAFKHTNLTIHLLCGCLVFWLAGRLGREGGRTPRDWGIALAVSTLWLLAPLQVSTVLYVIQRMAQLSTLFCLLGILLYVIGRQNMRRRAGFWRDRGLILSALFVAGPLAVFSKENGILLPFLLLTVEVFLLRFQGETGDRRFVQGFFLLTALLPMVLAIGYIMTHAASLLDYSTRNFTLGERLLTEPHVLLDYLRNLIVPELSQLGVYHDDFPISRGLWTPPFTALALLVWLAVLAVLGWLMVTGRHPREAFGVAFFLVGHSLEGSIFPLEIYFEHRNYLPSVGIFFAVVLLMERLLGLGDPGYRRYWIGLAAVIPLLQGVTTIQRVQIWSSWEQLVLADAEAHPNSVRVQNDLMNFHLSRGLLPEALQSLDRVASLDSRQAVPTAVMRLVCHCFLKAPIPVEEYEQLERQVARAEHINPVSLGLSLENLRDYYGKGGCPQLDVPRVIEPLEIIARDHHANWSSYVAMGQIWAQYGDAVRAGQNWAIAWEKDPADPQPGFLLADSQLNQQNWTAAIETVAKMRQRDSGQRNDYTQAIRNRQEWIDEHLEWKDNQWILRQIGSNDSPPPVSNPDGFRD